MVTHPDITCCFPLVIAVHPLSLQYALILLEDVSVLILHNYFLSFTWIFQVKEVDLDTAIKCLACNYKIFQDSGSGLEPVILSIGDRMDGMAKMIERKAGNAMSSYWKKNLFFKQMNFHCSTYLVLITLINLPFFRWTQTNCSPLYMRKEQISCHKFGLQDITKFNLYFNWSDVLLKVSTWSDISTITTSAHPSCSTIPSETANNKLF